MFDAETLAQLHEFVAELWLRRSPPMKKLAEADTTVVAEEAPGGASKTSMAELERVELPMQGRVEKLMPTGVPLGDEDGTGGTRGREGGDRHTGRHVAE